MDFVIDYFGGFLQVGFLQMNNYQLTDNSGNCCKSCDLRYTKHWYVVCTTVQEVSYDITSRKSQATRNANNLVAAHKYSK